MKRRIEYSTKFRKDFKKYSRNPEKVAKIRSAVSLLEQGAEIPRSMRPHKLIGNYAGYMELHIEGDLLLIWFELDDKGIEAIRLVRLGSHSELFGV